MGLTKGGDVSHRITLKKMETAEVETDDLAGMIDAATRLGFTVDEIDDHEVIAFCESCQVPILSDDEYVCDPEDGIYLCAMCAAEIAKEET